MSGSGRKNHRIMKKDLSSSSTPVYRTPHFLEGQDSHDWKKLLSNGSQCSMADREIKDIEKFPSTDETIPSNNEKCSVLQHVGEHFIAPQKQNFG